MVNIFQDKSPCFRVKLNLHFLKQDNFLLQETGGSEIIKKNASQKQEQKLNSTKGNRGKKT